MKCFILLFFSMFCFSVNLCWAQGCESVQKIEAKDGIGYIGLVHVARSNKITQNEIHSLFLGKAITKSDTSYTLSVGINAIALSNKLNRKGVAFQFEDGSELMKSDQLIDILLMAGNDAMLTAQVDLTVGEIMQMGEKLVTHISFAESKTNVPPLLSKSIKEVATCLPNAW